MQASVKVDFAARTRPARRFPNLAALSLASRLSGGVLLGLSAAAAVTFAAPSVVLAAPAEAVSIVVHIEGPNADAIREDILSFAPTTLDVVDPDAFSKALKGAGQKGPVGDLLLNKKQRQKIFDRIRKAGEAVNAQGVIFGLSRKNKKKKREIHIVYVNVNGGDVTVDEAVPMTDSRDERKGALEGLLGTTLAEIAPPPPEEDKKGGKGDGGGGDGGDEDDEEEDDDDGGAEPERKPNEVGSALASIEVGFELGGRWFDYSDGVTQNLRPYSVFGAPTVSISGEVYPLVSTGIPVLKGLGLTVGYARAIGLDSALEGGEPIGTTYQRFNVGLRERLSLSDSFVLGISAGLRFLTFELDEPQSLAGQVPDVSYTILRGGLDARVGMGPIDLALGADYLMPLSSGEVYDRFTDPSVSGIGVMGGVILPIASGFEARLLVEYARFFSSFSPKVGDAYIAGGALDQYLGLRLAGAYIY